MENQNKQNKKSQIKKINLFSIILALAVLLSTLFLIIAEPDQLFTHEAASGCAIWLGATDTNWSIATNWDTGTIPNSTTCVILNNTASNQPTLNEHTSIYNLTINGTLTLSMPWGTLREVL